MNNRRRIKILRGIWVQTWIDEFNFIIAHSQTDCVGRRFQGKRCRWIQRGTKDLLDGTSNMTGDITNLGVFIDNFSTGI